MQPNPDAFRHFLEQLIPFNKFLGLKLESFDADTCTVTTRLELKPDYVGNPIRQVPHGGLISFLIDATSSAAAFLTLDDISRAESTATVDMNVDYLKTARGSVLLTTSNVIRSGKNIIFVQSEVKDGTQLIALGRNVFHVSS